jgi:DNA polymerase I
MGRESLAVRIGQSPAVAAMLLQMHHELYARFWRWSEAHLDMAALHGSTSTVFGWRLSTLGDLRPRTLRNFPMQANGAEMLRLACCFATETGVRVCAPVHDALLIEAPMEALSEAILTTQTAMARASRLVLNGFELRSEAHPVVYPDRYHDKRGVAMWEHVQRLLESRGALKT